MKKIKIMLLSFILFVAIGGVLAFKARLARSNSMFCTTSTINGTCGLPITTCPNFGNGTYDQQNQQPFVCQTKAGTYVTHSIAGEEQVEDGCYTNVGPTEWHITTTLPCGATTTRIKQGD